MGKALTEDFIIQKTKCQSLQQIKNLNLWGCEIDDVSILKQLPNAEVLSLSVNKIQSLKDFSYCKNLQELYLRKNNISDLSELKYLTHLNNLKVLWLQDNPCADTPDYRLIVISYLPNLSKLDNTSITPQEKSDAMKSDYNYQKQYEKEKPTATTKFSSNNNNNNDIQNNPSIVNENSAPNNQQLQNQQQQNQQQSVERQNQNIVCAVLSLIQDLDINSLEIVRRDVLRKLDKMSNN